jgi:hypothetical protein
LGDQDVDGEIILKLTKDIGCEVVDQIHFSGFEAGSEVKLAYQSVV